MKCMLKCGDTKHERVSERSGEKENVLKLYARDSYMSIWQSFVVDVIAEPLPLETKALAATLTARIVHYSEGVQTPTSSSSSGVVLFIHRLCHVMNSNKQCTLKLYSSVFDSDKMEKHVRNGFCTYTSKSEHSAANNHHFKHRETNNQTQQDMKKNEAQQRWISNTNMRRKIASAQQFQAFFFSKFLHMIHTRTYANLHICTECTRDFLQHLLGYWFAFFQENDSTKEWISNDLCFICMYVYVRYMFFWLFFYRSSPTFFYSVLNVWYIWKTGKL